MISLMRWANATALAAAAIVLLIIFSQDGRWVIGGIAAVVLLVGAWFLSPLNGRSSTKWTGNHGKDEVVIFWRPGCVFCIRMKASLGRAGRKATWYNIWSDPAAAEFVRAHNNGNETVPTVILRGGVATNPEPGTVRQALERVGQR
ncbi:glutaredoxin family protein [Arthrobacter roseus]|uniref:glutaredoxin family protein n=1 Tax=Arthrobacter roseus TaxID=136274 RepID=UPI001EF90752|nr:glutaredoxin domain-containing protein [Arthrobacter roseus]MBM7846961.1 glutaredoxin [Arthrobacter roseus]